MNNAKWQEYKARFGEWWLGLAEREQQLLAIGAVVVGSFILYAGIWSPVMRHLEVMRKQILAQQKTLLWMKSADKEIQKLSGKKPQEVKAMTSLALISLLQKQIKQSGLAANLTSLKQASDNGVEIRFQKVEFDKLIIMLTLLVKEYHIHIDQMSAVGQGVGVVDINIKCSR